MHGLDWYDYGARNYEPVLSRFTTIDPLAEKYYSISPYAYCAGNPVMFVDPDGRKIVIVKNITTVPNILAPNPISMFPSPLPNQADISDKFENTIIEMQSAIRNDHILLDIAVDDLINSQDTYTVRHANFRKGKYKGNNGYNITKKEIYINTDRGDEYYTVPPLKTKKGAARAGYSHELGHGHDDVKGVKFDFTNDDKKNAEKGDKRAKQKIELLERKPIEFENYTRKNLGIPLREKYF